MSNTQTNPKEKSLGAGRSGEVFLIEEGSHSIARKIFLGDTLANLVHYVFFGSPNAYIWNEDAIRCSYYRRKILVSLVEFWFGDRLQVSDAFDTSWNSEKRAYQMDTEFLPGRPVALCQPLTQEGYNELHELVYEVMQPLQEKLAEAGLDGLVWQAGKGNPVAANNFLLISSEECKEDGIPTQIERTFAWIDLESGVPALFPLNVLKLFTFYIPKSLHHGHALFDDVDIPKLKKYVREHQGQIEGKIGAERREELLENISYLEEHQKNWRNLEGLEKSLQYHLKRERLTQSRANWYLEHRSAWYMRELRRLIVKILNKVFVTIPKKIFNKIKNINFGAKISHIFKLLTSHQHRLKTTQDYVRNRIKAWEDRNQITEEDAEFLNQRIEKESSNEYIIDFSVHLAIKFSVAFFEIFILPLLIATGVFEQFELGALLGTLLLMDGPLFRSIYTGYRMIQAFFKKKEIPWVAFLVGLLPGFGSLAYPCQMVYSATGSKQQIAKFIVVDFLTRLGGKIPIWGGKDTLTEHFFNRCAYKLTRGLQLKKAVKEAQS